MQQETGHLKDSTSFTLEYFSIMEKETGLSVISEHLQGTQHEWRQVAESMIQCVYYPTHTCIWFKIHNIAGRVGTHLTCVTSEE